MTAWNEAVALAKEIVARHWPDGDLRGAKIVLADYDGGRCYRTLKPDSPWSLEFHRNVNQSVARQLRKMGAEVRYEKIDLQEFLLWLKKNNLENDTANRAAFVNLKCRW